jgi:Flp pilus assembly protein TadB
MNTRAETITIPGSKAEDSAQSKKWLRVKKLIGTPYLSPAALAVIAVTASVVWFVVGGWWWFPMCVVVSAVSMVELWRSVYTGWMQRKAMHQRFGSTKETP